ncbi:TetR family transcriptional regulator [Arthrobacter roseus]|uniref:TetR family transcriptional regulator n=1 Tax=Arthrobacter roseus TaxID=136274 RepID=UPI0019624984|nr:AcrR family transcriptional regulator [Arthrobacter roseus]
MSELLSTSLRDRKRTETWSAIHNAATELTLVKGPTHVTVEDITSQANVSQRTFFNYFATKEDAILGLQEPVIDEHVRDEFDLSCNVLERVSHLLLTVGQSTFAGDRETSLRFEVLEKYPELMHRRIAYIAKVDTLVMDLVRARLELSEQWLSDFPDAPPDESARLIVLMASATMRFAMQSAKPTKSREAQFVALDDATTLLRTILRKVQ